MSLLLFIYLLHFVICKRFFSPYRVSLEAYLCLPISINNLLWLTPKERGSLSCPIIRHSLKIWDDLKIIYKLISPHTPLLSILGKPVFPPGLISLSAFHRWLRCGLYLATHFLNYLVDHPVETLRYK